jgi:hypothetical protein
MRRIGIEYSIIGNHRNHQIGQIGIGYIIVGMIVLDSMIGNHRITWTGIENSIFRMIG